MIQTPDTTSLGHSTRCPSITSRLTATQVLNHYQLGANTNADSTGPTGGSIAVSGLVGTGSLYSTSTTLHVTTAKGTDPSGLASTGALEFESTAPLTSTGGADGVCGTFGALTLVATDPSSPSTLAVTDNQCYILEYSVPDVLGNYTTYSTGIIKVDTTAPADSHIHLLGAHRDGRGGDYRLRPLLSVDRGEWIVHREGDLHGSDLRHRDVFLPNVGHELDNDGHRSDANLQLDIDARWLGDQDDHRHEQRGCVVIRQLHSDRSTRPHPLAPRSISYLNGTQATFSTPVSFTSGTDTGSGIATTTILRRVATLVGTNCVAYSAYTAIVTNPLASPYTDTALTANHCYQYELTQTDAVGNATTTTSTNVLKVN